MEKIKDKNELDKLKNKLKVAANKLTFYQDVSSGIELLEKVKFEQCGFNPENPEKPLNFIEQVNQTFTAMVTYQAVEWLWENGYENQEFSLNLGPQGGYDIVGDDVVAEVFAVVSTNNNQKLKRDIAKVRGSKATSKYVFYTSPEPHNGKSEELNGGKVYKDNSDVTIVYFPLKVLINE